MDLSNDNKNRSRRVSRAGTPIDKKLVIGIAVVVILAVEAFASLSAARKRAADEEAQSIEASIAESESQSIAEAERTAAEAVPELTVCEIPEISMFVQEYFDARLR
ncbi:MAG: hypothetical protein Q4E57_11135, partial [Eubacteriales bacterium]|nr:hypothetical protein [Eubacteriales bacterium]